VACAAQDTGGGSRLQFDGRERDDGASRNEWHTQRVLIAVTTGTGWMTAPDLAAMARQ